MFKPFFSFSVPSTLDQKKELNPNTNTDDLFYTQQYDKRSKFSCEEEFVTSELK